VNIVKPKVELINYTQAALELLLFTKGTRLQGRTTLDEIKAWSYETKMEHLAYMRDTIKSSWEFIDYVFLISGVSRAFTHQFVRTRDQAGIDDPAFGSPAANPAVAAFAQESQRTVDASENGVVMPPVHPENYELFEVALDFETMAYKQALDSGEPAQNARALLPTAVSTSIIAKLSLRALHHMAEVRLCTRTQGEYQNVFRMMREAVYRVHPWALGWIEVFCVNHGTCCFPRYTECPIQALTYLPDKNQLIDIYGVWEDVRHEATPASRSGKTM